MNGVVMLLTLLAAAVLQHTVPGAPLFAQAKLPLVLGVVLYYALNRTPALMLAAAGLALGVGGLLMAGHESLRGQAWPGLLLKAAGTGLGGLVTAPLVFAVLDRFDRWTGNVAGGTSP